MGKETRIDQDSSGEVNRLDEVSSNGHFVTSARNDTWVIALDCWTCYNCGKLGHQTKDCLNCYGCGKPGHFVRGCPEQVKSTPKQGNAGGCALTQGEAELSTSQVVAIQISIAYTSAYTLINSGVQHSYMFAQFVKELVMELKLLGEVCVVSL